MSSPKSETKTRSPVVAPPDRDWSRRGQPSPVPHSPHRHAFRTSDRRPRPRQRPLWLGKSSNDASCARAVEVEFHVEGAGRDAAQFVHLTPALEIQFMLLGPPPLLAVA